MMDTPRLYGRRKGRPLRARKAQLMKDLLPQLQIEWPAGAPILKSESRSLDPYSLFSFKPQNLWLEIGFGGGEHIAGQAQNNPTTGFIGCEPFVNGIASLLDHIDRNALQNIRIFPNDARLFLNALPDAAFQRCFLLFPDPWPKSRHSDRRFLSSETTTCLARIMQPGAELRLASDDPGMIAWFRHVMNTTSDFRPESDGPEPPLDWVPTRYQQKAIKAGRQPAYLVYRRI